MLQNSVNAAIYTHFCHGRLLLNIFPTNGSTVRVSKLGSFIAVSLAHGGVNTSSQSYIQLLINWQIDEGVYTLIDIEMLLIQE